MKLAKTVLAIFFITFLGLVIYRNSFACSFHFDDYRFIVENPAIKNIHDLLNIWNYYPCRFVTFISLALNYHFDQLHVFGYHLFNLAVHLLTSILVYWLILITLSTPTFNKDKIAQHAHLIALMSAMVFVSHPIQTEAVTFIWQRTASMATMFYLASLCFYVKSRLAPQNTVLGSNLFHFFH